MTDLENHTLAYLRKIDEKIDRLSERMDNFAAEMRVMKGHVAALVQSDLTKDDRFGQIEVRLDRIEHRLNLADVQ